MIITISGPSCTGKTTLVTNLCKRSSDLKKLLGVRNVLPVYETARFIFEKHYSHKYKTLNDLLQCQRDTLEYHHMIAQDQKESLEIYKDDPNRLYICDRGPLDTAIYLKLNYVHSLDPLNLNSVLYKHILGILKEAYIDSKAISFRTLPFDTGVQDDGFRPEKYKGLRDMEVKMFEEYFSDSPVLPDGEQERVDFIFNYLAKRRSYSELYI